MMCDYDSCGYDSVTQNDEMTMTLVIMTLNDHDLELVTMTMTAQIVGHSHINYRS